MKIHIDINVSSLTYNDEQMEQLRVALRQQLTGFIFKVTEGVQTPSGATMRHHDIDIEGNIKMVDA